jgi:hypothetical protein
MATADLAQGLKTEERTPTRSMFSDPGAVTERLGFRRHH